MNTDKELLTSKQKHFLGDKLMDALNYSVAVTVFNEALRAGKLSVIMMGSVTYLLFLGVLTAIQKEG